MDKLLMPNIYNENDMKAIKKELKENYNIDVKDITKRFQNSKNKSEYKRNPNLIFYDFFSIICDGIDDYREENNKICNVQFELSNYYSLTQKPTAIMPKIRSKNSTWDKEKNQVNIVFNPENPNKISPERILLANSNREEYINHIINDIRFNQKEQDFAYYQLDAILHSYSFFEDIFIDIYCNYKYHSNVVYTLNTKNLVDKYESENNDLATYSIDYKKRLQKYLEDTSKPFSILIEPTNEKNKINLKNCGTGFQIEAIFNENFIQMFRVDLPNRKSCSYQVIKEILSDMNSRFKEEKIDNNYLFERTTGFNLCIHIFNFINEHIRILNIQDKMNDRHYSQIEALCEVMISYPNVFSKGWLIDEVFSVYAGNVNITLEILLETTYEILKSHLDVYKMYYEIQKKAFSYFINEFPLENPIDKKIDEVIENAKLSNWFFDPRAGIIESYPARKINNLFASDNIQKDFVTKLYKRIQNFLISKSVNK